MRLSGRRAAVVGSGSAIGAGVADRFAEEGAEVLRFPDLVADAAGAAAVLAAAGDALDILAVCTGAMDDRAGDPDDPAEWERVARVNLHGPMLLTRALAPLLTRSGVGSVVFLSSVDGLLGNPMFPAYSALRGGVAPLVHVLAHDLAPRVRVNAVAVAAILPTATPEDLTRPSTVPLDVVTGVTPLGRAAKPSDVAGPFAFLASDDAAYVTGTVLVADGGRMAVTPGTGAFPR